MASGKGAKKRGSRKGKARGTGPLRDTLSVAAADDAQGMHENAKAAASPSAVPDRSASTSLATERKGSSSIPTASSSSAKQAQMVFTVGTFDEYDGEEDGDSDSSGGKRSNALRSRIKSLQRSPEPSTNGPEATATVVATASNPRSSNGPSAAARASLLPGSSASQSSDEDSARDRPVSMQASQRSRDSQKHPAVTPPKSRQQARQPLFIMGSHSEMSDMDYADGYDTAKGQGSPGRNWAEADEANAIHAQLKTSGDSRPKNLPPNAKVNLQNSSQAPAAAAAVAAASHSHAPSDDPRDAESTSRAISRHSNVNGVVRKNQLDDEHGESHSPAVLHACKAMTSLHLAQQPSPSHGYDEQSADAVYPEMLSSNAMLRDRVTSAPSIQGATGDDFDDAESDGVLNTHGGEERAVSEGLQRGRGKTPLARESHTRLRKKTSARKAHVKKAVSSAALRTRLRYGGAHRRDNQPAKTHLCSAGVAAADGDGSHVEGSYVDFSGDGESEEEEEGVLRRSEPQQQQQQQAQLASRVADASANLLDQPRVSPHSSTATLGDACHDADDTATTASMDSSRQAQTDAMAQQAPAPVTESANADASTAAAGGDLSQPQASPHMHQQPNSGHTRFADTPQGGISVQARGESLEADRFRGNRQQSPDDDQYVDGRGQLNGGRDTHVHQHQQGPRQDGGGRRLSEEHPMAAAGYGAPAHMSMSTNRNMESLRQQSIMEREEEELELASSQLTGVPRRSNRPPSMVPHVFLSPNTPAYAQQIRKTERVYAHARSMAHPLLESISRSVALREQRLAMGVPRVQPRSWASRRTLAEPGEVDLQAEWWESLMPPPPSQPPPPKDQRTASGRAQPAELPHWVLAPDEAKCAVYGPDLATPALGSMSHDSVDPSCEHVRELRARAKELRFIRQQTMSVNRSQTASSLRSPVPQTSSSTALLETWRGRRVPGLLSVEMYTGTARPLELSPRHVQRQNSEPLASSSPDSIKLGRTNQLAAPYRRYGTVYGCTTLNPAAAPRNGAVSGPHAMAGGPGIGLSSNLPSSAGMAMRGQDAGLPSRNGAAAGIWDNDPRRSSYFDRLSVDEPRPQVLSSSNAQTTPGGFLRRVISGLAGGTAAAFGASQ
ncbi:hypothetical protein IWW45_001991 [Coemansia sp. RSA 485]|nr:hypothetical protein IWW45_001991 [Coemansia sp. RSA 485]